MKNKILRLELYLLLFLTLISIFYYFFRSSLPDNTLSISSESSTYFHVTYYISSFFALISYYVGPWVFFPLFSFSFIYSFIISRREQRSDLLIFAVLCIFFYSLTLMIFPSYLGDGLRILSEENTNIYAVFLICLCSGVLSFYMTLRGAFFILLRKFLVSLDMLSKKVVTETKSLTLNSKNMLLTYSDLSEKSSFRNKAKDFLASPKTKIKNKSKVEEILPEKIDNYRPRLNDKAVSEGTIIATIENVEEQMSDIDESSSQALESVDPELLTSKKTKVSNSSTFFKSEDLINCINVNVENANIKSPDDSYFKSIIDTIESKLGEFKLDGTIINILKGPVVDTFELELGAGVKVSKVTGLSDDIGLALNGAPIRIVYPMRGKSTIGIEVPRNPREFILLDEVLQSNSFNVSTHRLPIAMGKDAFGDVKVVDLAGMPHMLVAGATGAGKSVFINTLLVSLIVKKSPRQLKLILIDPKQLELALFQDLPHLMLPVITDPKSSAISLLWAVQEMDKRYTILKEMGVKNIEGFNKKVKVCDPSILLKINEYYEDREDEGYELPYIVIVIDEFADLILSKSGKEIELNVNRLAAKARAAGIHLVVATQRPSTDVVTGVVKANFPTRVAFKVATGHDSRTILDQYGAEKLLGRGDMLYKHGVDLVRVHSSFVDEIEIEGLIEKLATIPQSYITSAVDFLENGGEGFEDEDELVSGGTYLSGTSSDPMYQQAVEVVVESGSASASMLQRRLRVGYNRAANLVEELEKNGIVGPAQGSKPRKVLARSE